MIVTTIIVDKTPTVVHKWTQVPPIGARVALDHGGPNAREVVVTDAIWFRNTQGEQAVDLICKATAKGKRK